MHFDPLRPFNDGAAPLPSGAAPGLRKPHAWATTFSTLCRTLDSRRANFTVLRDLLNVSRAASGGPSGGGMIR